MMSFFRRHVRKIFFVTITAFMGGTFVGLGSFMFGEARFAGSAAVVNGVRISNELFVSMYAATYGRLQREMGFSPEVINVLRRQTLDMLIQEELLWQMSKKYGITVTDAQVATRIQSDPGFANEFGQFDPRIYFHFLNYIRMTPKDFESVQRRQLAGEKLTILLASAVKVSDSELAQISRLTGDAETDFAITLQSKANYFLNVWFRRVLENANIRILLTF